MSARYLIILICLSVLSFSPSSNADEIRDYSDHESPGSFVAFEVGPTYILSDDGSGVGNPFMIYFNVGLTLDKFFDRSMENRNFTLGPRIGLGFARTNPTADKSLFYNIIANFRYTPGDGEGVLRPFIEGGPGLGNYTGGAAHVDLGAGLDIFFNSADSIGIAAHYNEYFTGRVERSTTFLGALTHHW